MAWAFNHDKQDEKHTDDANSVDKVEVSNSISADGLQIDAEKDQCAGIDPVGNCAGKRLVFRLCLIFEDEDARYHLKSHYSRKSKTKTSPTVRSSLVR